MLTGLHRRLTVMAGEGPPSMPLFSQTKGVVAVRRRHDEWGRPTDRYLRPLVSYQPALKSTHWRLFSIVMAGLDPVIRAGASLINSHLPKCNGCPDQVGRDEEGTARASIITQAAIRHFDYIGWVDTLRARAGIIWTR
jgi:hypothetical protein